MPCILRYGKDMILFQVKQNTSKVLWGEHLLAHKVTFKLRMGMTKAEVELIYLGRKIDQK